ncbi:MAG: hypothetical protein WCQ21_17875 [Verrucomicrobiota bacterium]
MAGARFVFQFLEEYLDVSRQALRGILLQEGAQFLEVAAGLHMGEHPLGIEGPDHFTFRRG